MANERRNPPPPAEWGPHFERLIRAAGYTQRSLADVVGVREETVGRWTSSARYPEPVHLLAIRDALRERGVVHTIDEILEPRSQVADDLRQVAKRLAAIERALAERPR